MRLENQKIFEASLLFILVFQTIKSNLITNLLVLALIAIFIVFFVIFSLPKIEFPYINKLRLYCFLAIVLVIFTSLLSNFFVSRTLDYGKSQLNDGMIMTEFATKALLSGKNPYAISYLEVVQKEKTPAGKLDYEREELKHFIYSPVTFFVSAPFFLLSENIFHSFDLRIVLLFFFFSAAVVGSFIVKDKILFLMLFVFNPVFLNSMLQGAVDIIPLTFLYLCICFLLKGQVTRATILLAIACGTKLTVTPFVPVYFLFLYLGFKKDWGFKKILIQLVYFVVASLVIYLPFLFWDPQSMFKNLVLYQISGGSVGRPIAGFLGIAQILTAAGLIRQDSNFPFYLLFIPVFVVGLKIIFNFLKLAVDVRALVISYVGIFFVFLAFSRIVQTDYLAYVSQFLVLSAFIEHKKQK